MRGSRSGGRRCRRGWRPPAARSATEGWAAAAAARPRHGTDRRTSAVIPRSPCDDPVLATLGDVRGVHGGHSAAWSHLHGAPDPADLTSGDPSPNAIAVAMRPTCRRKPQGPAPGRRCSDHADVARHPPDATRTEPGEQVAEALSQSDIDSLLAMAAEHPAARAPRRCRHRRAPPAAAAPPARPRRRAAHRYVRKMDFARPSKFNKDQLRTLQMLHEAFCRRASHLPLRHRPLARRGLRHRRRADPVRRLRLLPARPHLHERARGVAARHQRDGVDRPAAAVRDDRPHARRARAPTSPRCASSPRSRPASPPTSWSACSTS